MAIRKTFGGQSVLIPGSYSTFDVNNTGGSPLGSNNTLLLVGESTKGAPGTTEGFVTFTAAEVSSLIAKYGTGPIPDAAKASLTPSNDGGIAGAGRIIVYKTNPSTQASAFVTIDSGGDNLFTVKDKAYGVEGNNLSVVVAAGSGGNQKIITVPKLSDTTEALGENDATVVLTVQYTGDGSTATYSITGANRGALTFDTTLVGQSDGSVDQSIALNLHTFKTFVDFINTQVGYTATLSDASKTNNAATEFDPVLIAADVKTSAVSYLRIQFELLELLNTSTRVEATIDESVIVAGNIDNQTSVLAGGVQGASTNGLFSTAFDDSLSEDYNVLLPLISRDATDDISDAVLGFTDAASTYTWASVFASADSHLLTRGNLKGRKEAQGIGGFRNAARATVFSTISALNSARFQIGLQDIYIPDTTGTLRVHQPHVWAARVAGIRLGTDVGEPLTHKDIKATNIGHVLSTTTLLSTGDFNVATNAETAIENGVTFSEPVSGGGFRVVLDNTTYQTDQSFVFNRGSVVEAVFFVNKTMRDLTDLLFVGRKTSNGIAASIKSAMEDKFIELNADDVRIVVKGEGAPRGFKPDTFVVDLIGNTIFVEVEYFPVQGVDFIFHSFTAGEATQSG